jgi:hypothetical protein
MTSKPSIFEKTIVRSHDYDTDIRGADIRALIREGKGARDGAQYANAPK